MQTDTSLADRVLSDLARDPRVPAPLEIAVEADHGVVTLKGTVESFAQRRAAVADAKRVSGVREVKDELTVSLVGDSLRADNEIRGVALQNLAWDVEVPKDAVDVKVQDGWVTLKGTVRHQFESDAAFDDVASLNGVVGVTNEILVVTG